MNRVNIVLEEMSPTTDRLSRSMLSTLFTRDQKLQSIIRTLAKNNLN